MAAPTDAIQEVAGVFAHYLIWDGAGGRSVKTTVLVTLEENGFFTRNIAHILVGKGHRKIVDPQVVALTFLKRSNVKGILGAFSMVKKLEALFKVKLFQSSLFCETYVTLAEIFRNRKRMSGGEARLSAAWVT